MCLYSKPPRKNHIWKYIYIAFLLNKKLCHESSVSTKQPSTFTLQSSESPPSFLVFPSLGCHSVHLTVSLNLPRPLFLPHRAVWAASIGVQLGVTFLPCGTSLGSRAPGLSVNSWTTSRKKGSEERWERTCRVGGKAIQGYRTISPPRSIVGGPLKPECTLCVSGTGSRRERP